MYKRFNGNLLFHGCVPLDNAGNFEEIGIDGQSYKGKSYLDYAEKVVRRAGFSRKSENDLDFMWYLWCGKKSPLSGRIVKTFELTFIAGKSAWEEDADAYYRYCKTEKTCNMILREFEMYSPRSHIINGHTPVKTVQGEKPVRANGKLLVIDGGFCRSYHKTTGIAGYTLIYNSPGSYVQGNGELKELATYYQDLGNKGAYIIVDNAIIAFCRKIGLPTTLKELGIEQVDDGKLMQAAVASCAENDTMGNMPFEVKSEDVFAAMKMADKMAQRFM
jgi:fructose-1,6-bisphosphatase-3